MKIIKTNLHPPPPPKKSVGSTIFFLNIRSEASVVYLYFDHDLYFYDDICIYPRFVANRRKKVAYARLEF